MNGYRPRDVAAELGISTEALRRCSVEFADLLSPGASAKGTRLGDSHEWLYTSQDIALLGAIRDLMNQGQTIQQVRAQLSSLHEPPENGAAPLQSLAVTQEVGHALVEVVQSQRATIAALEGQVDLLRAEAVRLRAELEHQIDIGHDQAELGRQAELQQIELERLRAEVERQRADTAQQPDVERQRAEIQQQKIEIKRQRAEVAGLYAELTQQRTAAELQQADLERQRTEIRQHHSEIERLRAEAAQQHAALAQQRVEIAVQ